MKSVVTSLAFTDCERAIEMLRDTLGFAVGPVFREDGQVVHAEARFGEGWIWFGPAQPTREQWPSVAGAGRTSLVTDADEVRALYARVQSDPGFTIIDALHEPDYGGIQFACEDFEGNRWNAGSYAPGSSPES